MESISGSNIILYKYDADLDVDIPIACGLECSFTNTNEVKEITSQSSAWFREFKYGISSWAINATGITILNDEYNYLYLVNAQKNRETLTIKYVIDNGGIYGLSIFSGQVVVQSMALTGTYNEISTYQLALLGSGEFSTSGTVITPGGTTIISGTTIQVFQYTAAGGETSIPFSGTVGLDAVYASRGGTTIQPIAYAGSPTAPNGGVWDTNTGQLNIDTGNPAFAGEYFLILAQ